MGEAAVSIDSNVAPLRPVKSCRIKENSLHPDVRGFVSTQWVADIPAEHSFDDVLVPDYWSIVAYQFKAFDTIICNAEDGSFYAKLLVRDCARTWAKVALLTEGVNRFDAVVKAEADDPEYEIKFRGRLQKHCIVRRKDGEVLFSGMGSKLEAMQQLVEYRRALAR